MNPFGTMMAGAAAVFAGVAGANVVVATIVAVAAVAAVAAFAGMPTAGMPTGTRGGRGVWARAGVGGLGVKKLKGAVVTAVERGGFADGS